MGGGKCGLIAVAAVLVFFGGVLLLNPISSPNFAEANHTIQMIAVVALVVGLALGALVLGSGSTFVNGSGNSWGNTTEIHIHQAKSDKVKKYMKGQD